MSSNKIVREPSSYVPDPVQNDCTEPDPKRRDSEQKQIPKPRTDQNLPHFGKKPRMPFSMNSVI